MPDVQHIEGAEGHDTAQAGARCRGGILGLWVTVHGHLFKKRGADQQVASGTEVNGLMPTDSQIAATRRPAADGAGWCGDAGSVNTVRFWPSRRSVSSAVVIAPTTCVPDSRGSSTSTGSRAGISCGGRQTRQHLAQRHSVGGRVRLDGDRLTARDLCRRQRPQLRRPGRAVREELWMRQQQQSLDGAATRRVEAGQRGRRDADVACRRVSEPGRLHRLHRLAGQAGMHLLRQQHIRLLNCPRATDQ